MKYLKAAAAGLLGAVLGIMLWVLVEVIYLALVLLPQLRGTGSGGIGAVSVGVVSPGLALAIVGGFAFGVWVYRRRAARLPIVPRRGSA